MRVMVKLRRIATFVNTGTLAVKTESVDDAILDVLNYMVVLAGLVEDRRSAISGSAK